MEQKYRDAGSKRRPRKHGYIPSVLIFNRIRAALPSKLHRALNAPPRLASICAVCRQWNSALVCAACLHRFAQPRPRCVRCAVNVSLVGQTCGVCLRTPPQFDSAVAAVDYGYPWATLVAQLKFNEQLDLCSSFAGLIADAQRRSGLAQADVLLPVPLSSARLRLRGFNQAWELARRLGKSLGRPAEARLLLRTRDSPPQPTVSRDQRLPNVRGAFAIEPLRRRALQGKTVALIDDVMTTGATLSELARVAKQAGAASVQVWVLARTEALGRAGAVPEAGGN